MTVCLCELQFNERFIMVLCINIILGVWVFLKLLFCFGVFGGGRGLEHVVKCLGSFVVKIVTC